MPIINTIGNASGRAYGFTRGGGKILISSTPGPAATVTTYSNYIVFKFTASATLNVGAGAPGTADVLLVAGGSPGLGPGSPTAASAGGPGGKVNPVPATTITANSPIPVVVGGASTNSTFGPLSSSSGSSGGAGGLGADIFVPRGGQPGSNGPTNNFLTGSPQFWSGGGGGGGNTVNFGIGGQLGGGNGGAPTGQPLPSGGPFGNPGAAGTANTGGGGGGASLAWGGSGGSGGSGIVVVRFPDTEFTT